jgi:hypothetical protein
LKAFYAFIITQEIDITEAFEAYHITDKASKVLKKYYIRDAIQHRNYKFTYNEDGFYRTLKRRVAEKLPIIDKSGLWKSKLCLDLILFLVFLTAILAVRLENLYFRMLMILTSSLFLSWLHAISHNFIHLPDNWRMYAANVSLVGWRDFRVFHAIVSIVESVDIMTMILFLFTVTSSLSKFFF